MFTNKKVGLAFGSGGIYAAAGIGTLEVLEKENIEIPFVAGASGGAIIAALYYLEGNAKQAEKILLKKLPLFYHLKLNPMKPPVDGNEVKAMLVDFLDGRDWKDGKLQGACFGAAYVDTHEPILLTKESGLSLVDCVLASISLALITPVVKLNNRIIAHGGDPEYISGLKKFGADFIVKVSPNTETGLVGLMAKVGNALGSIFITKGNSIFTDKLTHSPVDRVDLTIHPNLSLIPFISPLTFSVKNAEFMIQEGRKITEKKVLRDPSTHFIRSG